jgi:hypothetical protein
MQKMQKKIGVYTKIDRHTRISYTINRMQIDEIELIFLFYIKN